MLPIRSAGEVRHGAESMMPSRSIIYTIDRGCHKAMWVDLEDKIREGLVRWYPVCGTRAGVAVIVNSEGVIEGWRAFVEDNDGEYAGKLFQVQVAYTLAFCTRFGRVKFWTLLKELNGIAACKHFEHIQPIIGEETKEYELSYGTSRFTAIRSLLPSYKR